MNRWIASILIMVLTVVAAPNCSSGTDKDKTEKKQTTADSVKKKVTFIELGSVKCIPCKMMQPVMEEIEKEFGNQVDVIFHDVWTDEGRPFGQKYGIRAIPTQIFLDSEGKEFSRHEGFFPKEELVKVLKQKGVQ
jgi:thioredoxin 1